MSKIFEMIQKNADRGLAIVDNNKSITYETLLSFCEKTKESFDHLHKGDRVIIYAKKSVEYVCVMVAMLSMGVAYLSLDEHTPVEKVNYYVEKLKAKNVFVDYHCKIQNEVVISEINAKCSYMKKQSFQSFTMTAESDLAYMICTSGSSGEPKIVMIEHHSLFNLVSNLQQIIYKEIATDRQLHVAVVAPFSFDASVKQIFCALCLGHTLFVCSDKDKLLGRKYIDFVQKHQIDVMDCTPTLISSICADKKRAECNCMQVVISGGEKLLPKHVAEVIEMFGSSVRLINVYGPTECCVDVTYYVVPTNNGVSINNIPIGKSLENVFLELDENKQLIIKGTCVGRGYWDNNCQGGFFVDENGEKCYRTGDICYEEDGCYYLVGRLDGQEKINGFRIEPSIVDYELSKDGNVEYSVTCVIEYMKRKVLCTVINSTMERKYILNYLKKRIPDYCIPKHIFYTKEALVQNKNGKTDMDYYKELVKSALGE